jgi:rhodanese-related sulfurtransferase
MIRILLAVALLACSTMAVASDAPILPQDALLQKMASGSADLLVLDVRTAAEFEQGHVPGAVNISHDQLESRLAELEGSRDSEIVVYCRSGRRSDMALDMLARAGFKHLYHLEGDYAGWTAAKRTVSRSPAVSDPPEAAVGR